MNEQMNVLLAHKLRCICGNRYNQLEMLLIDSGMRVAKSMLV